MRIGRPFFYFAIVLLILGTVAEAAPLTGPRFKMALATPAMRSWAECPLRQVIDQLGVYHRVAIFLDRRVDPGQKTSMNALMMPLGQTLDQLADTVNTKAVRFGSVIYIGPETTGHMLSILSDARREEARKMPDRGRAMLTPKSMKWDDLATPRELLKSLSEETGIPIGPVEAIPHDLWAGAELPSSSPVDRLTLILSQFDKTFSIAADAAGKPRILIVDIPEQVKKQAAAKVPSNETGTAGKTPSNSGTARHGSANNSGNFSRIRIKRFAVKQKQVETVLNYLASQWGLTLEVDRRKLKTKLKRRINVTKEEVTVGELLRAVLEPVGLQGEIDEQKRVLRVRVKQ